MLDLLAGNHDLPSALHTPDLEVHADAKYEKAVVAAGMGLLHHQLVVHADIQVILPLLQSHNHSDYNIYR